MKADKVLEELFNESPLRSPELKTYRSRYRKGKLNLKAKAKLINTYTKYTAYLAVK